jgi:ankyrin repeat protein
MSAMPAADDVLEDGVLHELPALMRACKCGDLASVQLLVAAGASVNADTDKCTPIMLAASGGHVAIVEFLADQGADLLAASRTEMTALSAACINGHTDVIDLLLARGVGIEPNTHDGQTALVFACKAGQTHVVKHLIARGADLNASREIMQTSPLMAAVLGGNVSTVELLLDLGVDVNEFTGIPGSAYKTALLCAAVQENTTLAALLLEHGAKASLVGVHGDDIMLHACEAGNVAFIQLLVAHGAAVNLSAEHTGDAPVVAAARGNHMEAIQTLLDAGADINARGTRGYTALHAAVEGDYPDLVRLLLARGASTTIGNGRGDTALIQGVTGKLTAALRVLIESSEVDLNATNRIGITALGCVCRSNHNLETAQLLLSRGAHVNPSPLALSSPLAAACARGDLVFMDVLVRHGAGISTKCATGTPLMAACRNAHLPAVQYLVDRGVDVNDGAATGETALSISCRDQHRDIVSCLLDGGANVNARLPYGETALFAAATSTCDFTTDSVDILKDLVDAGGDLYATNYAGLCIVTSAAMTDTSSLSGDSRLDSWNALEACVTLIALGKMNHHSFYSAFIIKHVHPWLGHCRRSFPAELVYARCANELCKYAGTYVCKRTRCRLASRAYHCQG